VVWEKLEGGLRNLRTDEITGSSSGDILSLEHSSGIQKGETWLSGQREWTKYLSTLLRE
jgi:hypothetical protein